MNIPLNIDWRQILLHLFNFGILAGGLWLLLYKPVKAFMDDRARQYEEREAEAEKKVSEAEELRKSYVERLASAEKEAKLKLSESAKAADDAARETMEEAKHMAEQLLAETRRKAEEERKELLDDAQHEVIQLASDAVRKLLVEQEEAYDSFAASFKDGNDNE